MSEEKQAVLLFKPEINLSITYDLMVQRDRFVGIFLSLYDLNTFVIMSNDFFFSIRPTQQNECIDVWLGASEIWALTCNSKCLSSTYRLQLTDPSLYLSLWPSHVVSAAAKTGGSSFSAYLTSGECFRSDVAHINCGSLTTLALY